MYKWGKKIEPKGWRKQRVSKIDMKKLEEDVSNNLDAYQYERAKRLKVSQAAVYFGLKRLGVTYKKTLEHPKADNEKSDMFLQKIEQWQQRGPSPAAICGAAIQYVPGRISPVFLAGIIVGQGELIMNLE